MLGMHLAGVALAQQPEQETFSLEECIEYAIRNNVNVKNQQLNRQIAQAQVNETLGVGLPQISGSAGLSYNIVTPQMQLPNFGVDPETGGLRALPGEFNVIPAGPDYSGNLGITVNQMIFDGSYFIGIKAAKVYKDLAEKDFVKATVDVAEGVSLAYYGTLVAKERLELLKINLDRLESLYRETKAMSAQGFAETIDVQRVQVNLNNIRTEYQNVQRSYGINIQMLKFQMGLPLTQEIALDGNINDFNLDEDVTFLSEVEVGNRIEYQQLRVNRELSDLEVRNIRVQYYPKVNAFFNHGYRLGTSNRSEVFDFNTGWFASGTTVGLSLDVPIFDGLIKANRIKRTSLVREQIDNQLQNLENSIQIEVVQAKINLQNSLQSLQAQEENIELAQEVFRVAKIKYQEGVGSNLEVIEAENAFKTAETNYFNSLYNALVARVAYQKATGTLLSSNQN